MKRNIMPKGTAVAIIACSLMIAVGTVYVSADAPPLSKTAQIMELLDEGVTHYRVGEYERAAEKFEQILELEPSSEVALMMRQRVGVDMLVQMLQREEMAGKAYEILRLSQEEIEVRRRDPEGIRELIMELVRPEEVVARARIQRELVAVGEFAVPFLLDLLDVDQEELYGFTPRERVAARASAQLILENMRHRAVLPLIEGLQTSSEGLRAQICGILGKTRDARAIPALKALVESPDTAAETVAVAQNALAEIGKTHTVDRELSAAESYLSLAESYYYADPRVIDYVPHLERTIWVWFGEGRSYADMIAFMEVPQYAYNELMAEKLICHGLGLPYDTQAAIEKSIPGQRYAPGDIERKLISLMAANNYAQIVEARLIAEGASVLAEFELTAEAREQADERAEELKEMHLINRLLGSPAIHDALGRQLEDGDFLHALESIADLKALGDTSVPDVENSLVEAINAPSMAVRYHATEAMMDIWPVGDLGSEASDIAEEARNISVANVIAAANAQAVPHVLVVTGEPQLYHRLAQMLGDINCTTERAATLSEAVKRARTELPFVTKFIVDSRGETLEITKLMQEDAATRYMPITVLAPSGDVQGIKDRFGDRVADVLAITARESAIINSVQATLRQSLVAPTDPVAGARERLVMMLESVSELPAHTQYPIDGAATALVGLLDSQPNEIKVLASNALEVIAHPSTVPPMVAVFLNDDEPEELRLAAGRAAVTALKACANVDEAELPAAPARSAFLNMAQDNNYSEEMREVATRLYSIIPPMAGR